MEPRPLLELNVQQAIASILQKPRWWVKWLDSEIRDKWLSEVELQLLLKTFEQSLPGWSQGREPLYALYKLLFEEMSAQKHEKHETHEKLRKWLQEVVTDFRKGDDEEEENQEGGEGENATKKRQREDAGSDDDEKRLRALEKEVEWQPSYPALKWTFNQLLLHERLSAVAVEDWPNKAAQSATQAARSVDDPILAYRAAEFVLVVRRGVSVEDALPLAPEPALLLEDRQLKLKLHCDKIHHELSAVQSYINKYLELVASGTKLSATTDPDQIVICPAGINGVWISDNIVSDEVATKFKQEGERAGRGEGLTPSLEEAGAGPGSFLTLLLQQMHRLVFTGSEAVERPQGCDTDYQWIPTDIFVDGGEPGNDVANPRVLSYINNLHPEQHADLYDSIGDIFGAFAPSFERMLVDQEEGMPRSAFRVNMQCHDTSHELPPRPKIPTLKTLPSNPMVVSLRGKKLQVIVKIAEIILTPEKPKDRGGSWHIEGSPAERIVGTGIY